MGCWNETCLLTRLPIQGTDPTVCLLIAERPEIDGTFYAEDIFSPVTLPIFGRYNEYGNLSEIEDTANTLKLLRKLKLYKKADGQFTEYAIVPTTPPELPTPITASMYTPEQRQAINDRRFAQALIEQAHRSELYVRMTATSSFKPDPVTFSRVFVVFILREFYDLAVKTKASDFAGVAPATLYMHSMRLTENLPAVESDAPTRDFGCRAGLNPQQGLVRDLMALNSFMGTMRIAWAPTAGSGSQNCLDNAYQVEFYEEMSRRANEISYQNHED